MHNLLGMRKTAAVKKAIDIQAARAFALEFATTYINAGEALLAANSMPVPLCRLILTAIPAHAKALNLTLAAGEIDDLYELALAEIRFYLEVREAELPLMTKHVLKRGAGH